MAHTAIGSRLQNEIDALVRKNGDVFSAVVGVATRNGDYWSAAAGIAHAGEGDEMKVDAPIFVASITKMYTAAVTMMLEERKLLSLDDPISKYLPAALLEGLHRYKAHDYSDQLRVYHLVARHLAYLTISRQRPRVGRACSISSCLKVISRGI